MSNIRLVDYSVQSQAINDWRIKKTGKKSEKKWNYFKSRLAEHLRGAQMLCISQI